MSNKISMRTLIVGLLFSATAFAQLPATSQLPLPRWQPLDNNGKTVPGGKLCFYQSGGFSNPLPTYTSAAGNVQNSNPIILDSAGRANVWFSNGQTYRVVFQQPGNNFCPGTGATIWTQDGVSSLAGLILTTLQSSSGAALVGYQLNATGSKLTTLNAEQQQSYELKADFGAKGDGVTNDTVAITTAITAAATNGYALHIAPGNYLTCGSTPTIPSGKDVVIYGDGMFTSTIKPFGGAVACNTALTISTTGHVSLHDFGCQYGFTGHTLTGSSCINITGPGSANALTPPNSVDIESMYFSQAKSVGIQCQPCQNVTYAHNVSYQNYFFAASFASSGTVASPIYLHGFNIHDNLSIDESIGVGLSFFLSDISITGNVFVQSNLSLVQMPHAYATIEGNTFDGVPDVGCYVDSQCGSISGSWDALFLEGVSDWTIGVNHLSNINGAAGVVAALSSNLTIGTQMELPTSRGHIDGLVIQESSSGFPLLLTGISNGSNPVIGSNLTVKNVKLDHVNECINISGAIGVELSNNYCSYAANASYILSNVQNGTFKNNTCRNCNTSGGTTYATGTLSATNGSATLTGSGTTWISGMVNGGITIAGTTYQILSRSSNTSITLTVPYAGTSGSGLSYSIYYGGGGAQPGLTISGTGTNSLQVDGNTFTSDSGNALSYGIVDSTGLTPDVSGIRYDTGNVCKGPCAGGIYSPVPTLIPALTSCGTSPVPATYNTNAQGLVVIGSGGPTSCTMTFSNSGFNQTPICAFTPGVNNTITRAGGTGATVFVFQNGDGSDMSGEVIQYSCSSAAGSVSAGWYPYSTPY